jgi:putative inorganic carbon (hco3(-)) transporter
LLVNSHRLKYKGDEIGLNLKMRLKSEMNIKDYLKFKPEYMLLFFILSIYPFIVVPSSLPYFYGPRYLFLSIISLFALLVLFNNGIRYIRKADIALAAFMVFLFISTLLSDDVATAWGGNSLRFTGASTYLFCAILFLLASRIDAENRILLIELMVYAAAVVSVIAIMQNYGVNIVPHEAYRASFHSYGTLGNPNFLGTYTVFILPASVMLFLYQKKRLWLICSALIFGALLVSLTRGSWLAFAGIYMIIIYHVYKNMELRKSLLTMSIVFVATYLLLTVTSNIQLTERASTITVEIANITEHTDTSTFIRFFVWQESLQILQDNWAFGIGADTISIPVPQGYNEDKAYNIFLEIAVTMGIFALISFLFLLYFSLRQKGDWVQTLISFMIIAYLFQAQFNIDVIMNLPLFWIILGLSQAVDAKYIYKISDDLGQCSADKNKSFKKTLQYIIATGLILIVLLIITVLYLPRVTVVEIEGQGKYEGQLRGINILHGYGELVMESGAIYEGHFKHGLFDGQGTLTYHNGSYYTGEFKQGFFHGKGKLISVDGDILEGNFKQGRLIDEKPLDPKSDH